MAMAVASSLLDRPIAGRFAFVGELGLSGEVRGCPHLGARISEAAKMGFDRIYVPEISLKQDSQLCVPKNSTDKRSIEVVGIQSIANLERLGVW